MMLDLTEEVVLTAFALRFDGYVWCSANHVEYGDLMNRYWDPESFDELLSRPADYQMAVMALQQRHYRWNDASPTGDGLALWRRLFLALVDTEAPAQFESEHASQWAQYSPIKAHLKDAIQRRLEQGTSADRPLVLENYPL